MDILGLVYTVSSIINNGLSAVVNGLQLIQSVGIF